MAPLCQRMLQQSARGVCSLVWVDVIRAEGLRMRLAPLPARVCGPSKAVRLVVQALQKAP